MKLRFKYQSGKLIRLYQQIGLETHFRQQNYDPSYLFFQKPKIYYIPWKLEVVSWEQVLHIFLLSSPERLLIILLIG